MEHGTKHRCPTTQQSITPLFSLSQESQTPAKREAPVDSVQSSPALVQLPPEPNVGLCTPERTPPEERTSQEPQLEMLGVGAAKREAPLTVAVGEVEVALGTGVTVLPSVVRFAVAAPSEVLAGAIREVRLTVTACREGQTSSSSLSEASDSLQQQNLSAQPCPVSPRMSQQRIHTHGSKCTESRWGGRGSDSSQGCTSHN